MHIAFTGCPKSGKTTHTAYAKKYLSRRGFPCVKITEGNTETSDFTVVLDIPAEVAMVRLRKLGCATNAQQLTNCESLLWLNYIRFKYLEETVTADENHYCLVDARKPIKEVWQKIKERLDSVICA